MAQTRFAAVLLGCLLSAGEPGAAEPQSASFTEKVLRPYAMSLSPDAIQDPHTPLRIDLDGPAGEKMEMLILPGCGNGTQPAEPPGRGACKSPVVPVREVLLDSLHGHASLEISLDGSDGRPALPVNRPLWIRVRSTSNPRGYRQARFGITKNRCSVWQSLLDQFGGGRCMLGLDAVFDPVRSSGWGRSPTALEARRIDPRRADAKPQPVAGTYGATGAAWDGPESVLVTLGAQSTDPGLFRIDLPTSSRALLYKPSHEVELTAPLPLSGAPDRLVSVVEVSARGSMLLVLRADRELRRIPLSGPVHQLLRVDASGQQVLGVRLRSSHVELFNVVLQTGIETTGGDAPLLLALRRSPGDGLGVLEYVDPAATTRSQLLLFDRAVRPLRELPAGPGNDMAPSWSRNGHELLYLGEVAAERKKSPAQGVAQ